MPLWDPALDAHLEETRNLNDVVEAFMAQVPDWSSPEGVALLRDGNGLPGQEPLDHAEVRTIDGPDGTVDLRILRPDDVRGVYLEIHGGGWAIGQAQNSDQANWALAEACGVATVSVDYRLAPEHPYPAGPDDCEAAALWLIEHATDEFGTDHLLIGGGSAGGHLAALTLLRLRDRHGAADRFHAANLVFGAYDLGMTPSQRAADDALVIPLKTMLLCIDYFLPGLDPEERRDPQYSPLYAELTGMPPALFTVGTLDPLLDDSLFMASRWEAAGNVAELAVYPESIHGFVSFPTELGRLARERMADFVHRHLP